MSFENEQYNSINDVKKEIQDGINELKNNKKYNLIYIYRETIIYQVPEGGFILDELKNFGETNFENYINRDLCNYFNEYKNDDNHFDNRFPEERVFKAILNDKYFIIKLIEKILEQGFTEEKYWYKLNDYIKNLIIFCNKIKCIIEYTEEFELDFSIDSFNSSSGIRKYIGKYIYKLIKLTTKK